MVIKKKAVNAKEQIASNIVHVDWRGPHSPIFITKEGMARVEEIIKKYNLKPMEVAVRSTAAEKARIPQLINGGMKALHIHYKGDTYLLTQEQWREFSGKMVADFKQKLTDAKSISFEQMVSLSETMSGIV